MTMTSSDVVAGAHGYASDYNKLRTDVKTGIKNITEDSDAATITFDLSVTNVHTVTLGGNRTLNISNPTVGQVFMIRLVQDGGGNRTITNWWTTIKWPGGTAPTLSTAGGSIDSFVFVCVSSGNYDAYYAGFSLS